MHQYMHNVLVLPTAIKSIINIHQSTKFSFLTFKMAPTVNGEIRNPKNLVYINFSFNNSWKS